MISKDRLEELYDKFNQRKYISPDPLELVYLYKDPRDREVVAFIAAMLSYGRVSSIVKNVNIILGVLGPRPHEALTRGTPTRWNRRLKGFKHRWTTHEEVYAMLTGLRRVMLEHGSLEACFAKGLNPEDETIMTALGLWARELGRNKCPSLISKPEGGSACKRLFMFLRWMVRDDEVDLGLWTTVSPSQIFVPLDTHMFSLCRAMGMTKRKQANFLAVKDITAGFKRLTPEDPVRYDFCLTRLGIRNDESKSQFLFDAGILSTLPDHTRQKK